MPICANTVVVLLSDWGLEYFTVAPYCRYTTQLRKSFVIRNIAEASSTTVPFLVVRIIACSVVIGFDFRSYTEVLVLMSYPSSFMKSEWLLCAVLQRIDLIGLLRPTVWTLTRPTLRTAPWVKKGRHQVTNHTLALYWHVEMLGSGIAMWQIFVRWWCCTTCP